MLRFASFVVLFALVCAVRGDADQPIRLDDFTCYPNQTIHFHNPDPHLLTKYRAFYTDGSGDQDCTYNTPDKHLNVYFNCSSTNYSITVYFPDLNISGSIFGGRGLRYTFTCNQLRNYNQTMIGNLTSVNRTKEPLPEQVITSGVFDANNSSVTSAVAGDRLTFTITGRVEYAMKPLSCVASGGNNTHTVITNGCSIDNKLVSNFQVVNVSHLVNYNMEFLAFKFDKVDDLTLMCTVKSCTSAGCAISCGSSRRRPVLFEVDGDDDAKVITVRQQLIVKGVVIAGSTRAYGPLDFKVATSIMLLIWIKTEC